MKNLIKLSPQQEKIQKGNGLFVVKACPGSGKTFSVTARIADLLRDKNKDFHFKGIAALSFTNVACREIEDKLQKDFEIPVPLKFPHFVGTIDNFINKYIFLPYGHLIMKCNTRPYHVGFPISYWGEFDYSLIKRYKDEKSGEWKISKRDPFEYFDKVTFDKQNNPIPDYKLEFFPFAWSNLRNKDLSYKKVIQDIINAKWEKFKEGKATQSDANYIAYKVLCDYKNIAENIVDRFSHFIIDEAQDTTDVQMGIIEKLIENGTKEMILIGDPDQAIFEWNDAKPEQFDEKYKEWEQSKDFDLLENRRSSKLICNCTRKLLSKDEYKVIGNDKDYKFKPQVVGHNSDSESVNIILTEFLKVCKDKDISILNKDGNNNIAVLYRSHKIGQWLGIPNSEKNDIAWKSGHYYARDIAQGIYLLDNRELRKGFKTIERGYHKFMNNLNYCSNDYIKKEINKVGFKEYRNTIFDFVTLLHKTNLQNMTLQNWTTEANKSLAKTGRKISIDSGKANISFDELFKSSKETKNNEYFIGTIHSAKGKTFEAVLVVLDKRFGNKTGYAKILKKEYDKLEKAKEKEEMRTIYVAITRPRKILVIAVPQEDCNAWKKKLDIK